MENSALLFGLAGLVAGLVHTLAGPDHLTAVAPLVLERPRRRWMTGLLWGSGHGLGVWGVGLLALLLRDVLPIEAVSSWSERLVGAVLIGVGLWGLRRAFLARVPDAAHPHEHRGLRRFGALGIGGLHGLAGSSHILGLLPALALPTRGASLGYVVGFGLGAVVAMTAFASALGLVAHRLTAFGGRPYQALLGTASAAAIVVGGWWLVA